jgi:hypothetical protein
VDIEVFDNKEQKLHFGNMVMYRLLFLYELLEYIRCLDKGQTLNQSTNTDNLLKDLPLILDTHYRYILENLVLPDDVLN